MNDPFYEKLQALSNQICKDFSDEGGEGDPSILIFRDDGGFLDSNFPWLYIRFGYEGPLSLYALKEIEKRYQANPVTFH